MSSVKLKDAKETKIKEIKESIEVPHTTIDVEKSRKLLQNIVKFNNNNPFYRRSLHPSVSRSFEEDFWIKPCKYACAHCGYILDDGVKFRLPPFPLIIKIKHGKYHADSDVFCTPNCCKSRIVYGSGYYTNQLLENLTLTLHDLYNCYDVIATVDRRLFERYGGPITREQYLTNTANICKLQIIGTPFVDTPLCIQDDFQDIVITKPRAVGKGKITEAKDAKDAKAIKEAKEAKSNYDGPVKMDTSNDEVKRTGK